MSARSGPWQSLSVLAIKGVLARVGGQISMRSLTAAIRTHCLDGHPHARDALLAFFLACESKLRRTSQQEWNRTIEHEIRRMVGLEALKKFVLRKTCKMVSEGLRECQEGGIGWQLQGLGEMEISEEVHLKTKYFCQWMQYLQERREIRRLKNKEVEDLKKSQLFSQYSLKFQSFLHWKQHTRKARLDRLKAQTITKAAANRATSACFAAFREKIDILAIESQLAGAVSAKLTQGAVRSVFGKLRENRGRERGRVLKDTDNIWVFRFYRHLTHRLTPFHTLTASKNRETLSINYQQLGLKLCWKGIKTMVQHTHRKITYIRNIRRNNAVRQFTSIQIRKKQAVLHKGSLLTFRRSVFLKELIDNIEACSQNSLKYAYKMESVQSVLKWSASKSFLSTFKQKSITWKHSKNSIIDLCESTALSSKKRVFTSMKVFQAKRGQYSTKKASAQCLIAMQLFLFRARQYRFQQASTKNLHESLSQYHNKHLLKMAMKSFALYHSVSLNQYETITGIMQSLRLKQIKKTFDDLRAKSELACRLQHLIVKSEWISLKSAFVTILNRMLSSKMKIKSFYQQQDRKLKNKLLELLKRNSDFMQGQREAVAGVALHYAKRRLIANLREQVRERQNEEELQSLREKVGKKMFLGILAKESILRDQLDAKTQEARLMLAGYGFANFATSAREFLEYRENEGRLTYKLQKALVKGVFRSMRKKAMVQRQQKQEKKELQCDHAEKIKQIQTSRAGRQLVKLLRTNPCVLREKMRQAKQGRVQQVLATLSHHQKQSIINKSIKITLKDQFISILRQQWAIGNGTKRLNKRLNKQKAKRSLGTLQINTIQQASQRQDKAVYLSEWIEQSRSLKSKQALLSTLISHADLKENYFILANSLLKNAFQRMLRQHLSRRSCAIKDVIALRLYASNLKRRALRGLRRATDVEVLKQNRAKTQQNSKLSLQKSIQHVRRRSKLMETIDRYNNSRISRVVR